MGECCMGTREHYTRIDIIRKYLDEMLKENEDFGKARNGFVHLYGVGQLAALIAVKRGHSREIAELAEIAGMLHDYYKYQPENTGKDMKDHAHQSEPVVRNILEETKAFTQEEIDMICQAIYNHSEKSVIGTDFDEILKDADGFQHWLRNPLEDYFYNKERVQKLVEEFGL